jgi:uncharacterized membrane protein
MSAGDGHSHSHAALEELDEGAIVRNGTVKRIVVTAVVLCTAATLVGLIAIWPDQGTVETGQAALDATLVDATVVDEEPGCASVVPGAGAECTTVIAEVTSGPTTGDQATLEQFPGANTPLLEVGDDIVVAYTEGAEPGFEYSFADYQRRGPLLLLLGLFVASVLVLGLIKGLRALLGAGVSLAVLIWVVLPALLDGTSPVTVALVSSSAIALLALYATHGVSHRTSVAYLGTVASLALTGALAAVFIPLADISGFANEDAIFLQVANESVDLTGLLLAGIVIGTLGVLDDVTVTQVSAVWELRAADPTRGRLSLYRAALRIGRDHIASSVNTLVLAYAGASLPLLLLFTQADRSLGDVANGEVVAVEIIRALVGSIGLVASVPLTTGLAVAVAADPTAAPTDAPGDGPDEEDDAPTSADPPAVVPPDSVSAPETARAAEPEPPPEPPSWVDFGPEESDF